MRHDSNLRARWPNFVTHLECAMTGERHEADQVHGLWRYRELLPVRNPENVVSLGECITPLVRMPKLEARFGGGEILVKDEGRLPTGSFKARGLVLAVSMAKALGIKHMAMPTNGNAGAALAAYASHAGIKTTIFCP